MTNITHNVDAERIEESIQMLRQYVKETSIEPVLSVLEAMKEDPDNESLLVQLSETFNALDIVQGAVLTYAPYVAILVSNNLFGDD